MRNAASTAAQFLAKELFRVDNFISKPSVPELGHNDVRSMKLYALPIGHSIPSGP
jgi:hypothetical protein